MTRCTPEEGKQSPVKLLQTQQRYNKREELLKESP